MNILFLYIRMFHPYRGGIERVSELLCKEFQRRGHNVFFLHSIYDETLLDYQYPAPIYFFPDSSAKNAEVNGPYYRDFLKKNHIDVVINQDPFAYHELCAFSKDMDDVHTISVIHANPLVIYDHLWSLTMRLRNKTFIEKFKRIARMIKVPKIKSEYWHKLKVCYKDTFAYSDLVCLLSLKFIPELKRIYKQDLNQLIAIGNPNTYPKQPSWHSKKKQILYVGRLEWYQKRIDRLADIWKYLYKEFPDWELVIVGDGPTRKELEQKFLKMERVVFVGYQNPEPFYRNASILCLTSSFEGWGMVLTEAMTFGTIPVVFNSYAAVTDIIEDGKTGLLVKPFSCKQFAYKLRLIMKNGDMRKKMSMACMKSVVQFDIQNIANQWEVWFSRLKNESHH